MLKRARLTLALGLLIGCSRHGEVLKVQAGQCWPSLAVGKEIGGEAKAYVSKYLVTVESGCPHDALIVIDGENQLAAEYNLLKRQSDANPDIIGFLFPVRFDGRLEARSNGFSFRASSIERTGPIEIRKISELQRHKT